MFAASKFIVIPIVVMGLMACSSSPEKIQSPMEAAKPSETKTMRHNLREVVEYDIAKMIHLVNIEINMKETNEDLFLANASSVLAETVLIQPHYTEREGALKELKGKIDQDDYSYVLQKAAENLLAIIQNSRSSADKATALVGLKNWVIEAKTLKQPELKDMLRKIADLHIAVTDDAKRYAQEPMQNLISPSLEAETALKTL
jgi:Mg2+ and Co2+ transporter CorA